MKSESSSVLSISLQPHGLHSPWNSPGQNTGVGSLFLLQGIFPTQGWNPGLPHCRWILYQLSHKGSPIEIYILIISLNANQPKCSNQKTPNSWMDTKQDLYIRHLQETHFRSRDTYKFKVRKWRKVFHANGNQKKARVATLRQNRL